MEILLVTLDHEGHLRVEESGGDALDVDWGFVLPRVVEMVAAEVCEGSEPRRYELVSRVRDALGAVRLWPDGPGRSSYVGGIEIAAVTCLRNIPAEAIRGLEEALSVVWLALKEDGNDYAALAVDDIRSAIKTVADRNASRTDAISLLANCLDDARLVEVRDRLRKASERGESLAPSGCREALTAVEAKISDRLFLAELEAASNEGARGARDASKPIDVAAFLKELQDPTGEDDG
jgi:hypothetical protein